MIYIPQIQTNDCGFACLKMLLCHKQKDRNYLFLRQDKEKGNYSYQQLVDIAKKEGVILRGVQVEDKPSIVRHNNFPIIVSLNTPSGGKHSVMVKAVRFNRVCYIDPNYGHTTMKLSSFIELWDGTALIVTEFSKKKCDNKEFNPISKFKTSLFYLGNIIVGILAILGVYFIKEDGYVFMPIIFFLLAVIVEILNKAFAFSLMKHVDDVFFENAVIKKKDYEETFRDYQSYKKNLFHSPLSLIVNVMSALGLIAVTLLNDYRNILLILVPILTSLIDYLVLTPYLNNESHKVEVFEKEIYISKTNDEYVSKIKCVHKKAYQIGKIYTFKRFAYLAAFVATAIVLIAVTRIVSFPFAVFYFCIEFALYEILSKIATHQEKENQLLKDKIKIANHLHQ